MYTSPLSEAPTTKPCIRTWLYVPVRRQVLLQQEPHSEPTRSSENDARHEEACRDADARGERHHHKIYQAEDHQRSHGEAGCHCTLCMALVVLTDREEAPKELVIGGEE